MRVVFFGTPDFAVPSLRALVWDGHEVVGVVTQPDRARGRSRSVLVPPAVKTIALEEGIPTLQPDRPTGDVFETSLERLKADIGVVVAYGHILRPEILAIPTAGMINVHASLLPRWRGAAPIQKAILEGDRVTGISIMQMEAGLDSGPVIFQVETRIDDQETAGALSGRLADLGAEALLAALERLGDGTASPETQDESAATFAPKVTREMARISWKEPAERLARQTRAYDPAPGAWAILGDTPIKLFHGVQLPESAEPGTIMAAADSLVVACGSGALQIREVQPAGKRRLPVAEWTRGRDDLAGAILR